MTHAIGTKLLSRLENVAATISDLFARPPNPRETALADRLRHDLAAMAARSSNQLPFWRATCEEMIETAATSDPRYFKRWRPIAATMVGRTNAYSLRNYWRLRNSTAWRRVWCDAIRLPAYGHSAPFLADPRTDAITVQHATNLIHFEQVEGHPISVHACIVEFGGGYGSFCRLLRRTGFMGRYIIFDQPPILALQRYYLGLHGLDAEYATEAPIILCSSLEEVKRFIKPDAALVSTWALSEMPPELRDDIEEFVNDQRANAVLFAYQEHFEGIDNRAYFSDLQVRHGADWQWTETALSESDAYVTATRQPMSGMLA